MVLTFSAPCFSGTCGFCASCCDAEPTSNEPEVLHRADDLKKFMFSRYEKELDHYNKNLNKLVKSVDYRCPTDIGFMKTKVIYGTNPEYNKYHLIQEIHSAVCDDQLCKVFYVSAHDSQHAMFYPKVPVYTRVKDDGHQLCAVCINRS
jgi:hypothetical protein